MGWAAVWHLCWLFSPQPAPSTSTPNVISRAWDRALTRTLVRGWERVCKGGMQAAHDGMCICAGWDPLPCHAAPVKGEGRWNPMSIPPGSLDFFSTDSCPSPVAQELAAN